MSHLSTSPRKRMISGLLAVSLAAMLCLSGCSRSTEVSQNKEFQEFTNALFCQEVSSNTISLHYTLQNPEEYHIKNAPVTYGTVTTDSAEASAAAENIKAVMERYDYKKLSEENQLTYDVLDYYMDMALKSASFMLYEEPLSPVNGVQTQLPILLSEYQFHDTADVETYLELMSTTPDYFSQLIKFEQKKAEAGLFMSQDTAQTVLEQCQAFIDMGESNYLISTFVERLKQMEGMDAETMTGYIEQNAQKMNDAILPAYEQLMTAVESLKTKGVNKNGLVYLPAGKEYYAYKVAQETGSSRTVEEIKALTQKQIIDDLEAMEKVLGIEYNQVQETAAMSDNEFMSGTNPVTMLNDLEGKITDAFPEPPDTMTQIKYVPEALEEHLSPAFYMIPTIDNTTSNVIYVNPSHLSDNLSLYTTLAHEGYPGHLYQTIYYAATNPDPLRSIFSFGGYVEGWATYAEMCSYYLTGLTTEQATLLQKNGSVILGLYTLADIGIHYEGWTLMDTIKFFSNYGITDAETVKKIFNLIIGDPANYLKYYIGYVEFLELKKEWIQTHGESYSQKEFHETVLSVGPAPFDIVKKYMK